MTKEELQQRIKTLEEHLELLFDAIPRSKKGLVFANASVVETTAKKGIVALYILANVWSHIRDQWGGDAEVAVKVNEVLAANGIT